MSQVGMDHESTNIKELNLYPLFNIIIEQKGFLQQKLVLNLDYTYVFRNTEKHPIGVSYNLFGQTYPWTSFSL